MIFGLGDGIAFGSLSLGISAIWIKVLNAKKPNGNGYVKIGEFNQCVKRLEDHMDGIDTHVSEIKTDIRQILSLHLK